MLLLLLAEAKEDVEKYRTRDGENLDPIMTEKMATQSSAPTTNATRKGEQDDLGEFVSLCF